MLEEFVYNREQNKMFMESIGEEFDVRDRCEVVTNLDKKKQMEEKGMIVKKEKKSMVEIR